MADDLWTSNLLDARLQAGDDGALDLTFPVSDREVSGGRAFARRRYPFRNGQSDEDTGGEPRTLTYTVPLFHSVEEGDYPDLFNDLIEAFESDAWRGRALLTDPEFGPLPVRMVSYEWGTSSKAREGGTLRMTFETLGLDETFTLLTIEGEATEAASNDAAAAADKLDTALADAGKDPKTSAEKMRSAGAAISELERGELGLSVSFGANSGLAPGVSLTPPVAPAPPSFTTSVTSSSGFGPTTVADDEVRIFSALVERFRRRVASGEVRTADEIGADLDVLRARIEAVRDDPDLTDYPEHGWPVLRASARLISAITQEAQGIFADAPRVLEYEVASEMSALEVAVDLFGDPGRVTEIIELNPDISPDFFPAGTLLVVPLD